MKPPYSVAQVLADTGPILLDFDGPVCSIFATLTDATVAAQLRQILGEHGVEIPQRIQAINDPLEVLRFTATIGQPSLTARVEDELRAAELTAADGARPTPYAREVIVAAHQAGRPIAIVSNNSAAAITHYLNAHRLARYIPTVVGRAHANPGRMKPNPTPIRHAVRTIGAKPAACVLVGDSVSDIEASRAAGVRTIGYANKPAKRRLLIDAGADAVTLRADGMAEIAIALTDDAADQRA